MWRILGPDIATAGFQAEKQKPDSISTCLLTIWSSHMWRPENIRNGWQQQLTPRQRNKKKQIPYQHGINNTPYSQGKFGYMILLIPPTLPIHVRPYQMEPPSCTEMNSFHVREYKRVHKVHCIPNQWWVLKLTCIHVLCSEIKKLEWFSMPCMKYSVIDISLIWHYEAIQFHSI